MFIRTGSGVNLHVQQIGAGKPVVMVHGLITANLSMWYFGIAPHIAKHFQVTMFDLPSHGRSDKMVNGYSISEMSAQLGEIIQRMNLGPVHLVGHSFGGCIATKFSIDNPDLVDSLCIIDSPFPPFEQHSLDSLRTQHATDVLQAMLPEEMYQKIHSRKFKRNKTIDNVEYIINRTTLLDDMSVEAEFSEKEIKSLVVPTTAIYGSDSDCRWVAPVLKKNIPQMVYEEVVGGHYLPIENVKELSSLVLEHLFSNSPVSSNPVYSGLDKCMLSNS